MKANELRIGNWVRLKARDFVFEMEKDWLTPSAMTEIEPIPLTSEWLLFLGLEKERNHYEKGHALWISLDGVIKGEPSIWIHGNYCPAIKVLHVHQLQNLYFALTGQDFTVAPQLKDLQLAPQAQEP